MFSKLNSCKKITYEYIYIKGRNAFEWSKVCHAKGLGGVEGMRK